MGRKIWTKRFHANTQRDQSHFSLRLFAEDHKLQKIFIFNFKSPPKLFTTMISVIFWIITMTKHTASTNHKMNLRFGHFFHEFVFILFFNHYDLNTYHMPGIVGEHINSNTYYDQDYMIWLSVST